MTPRISQTTSDSALTAARNDIQDCFRRFDTGEINQQQLLLLVKNLGFEESSAPYISIDSDLRNGTLTFRSFVQSCYLGMSGNRRNRLILPKYIREDVNPVPAPRPVRNPVTWTEEGSTEMENRDDICSLLKSYIEGKVSTSEFREYLSNRRIAVSGELDQLLRSHDADNSVTFQELARVLLWMRVEEMQTPQSESPSFRFEGGEVRLRTVNPGMARKNKSLYTDILAWNSN